MLIPINNAEKIKELSVTVKTKDKVFADTESFSAADIKKVRMGFKRKLRAYGKTFKHFSKATNVEEKIPDTDHVAVGLKITFKKSQKAPRNEDKLHKLQR